MIPQIRQLTKTCWLEEKLGVAIVIPETPPNNCIILCKDGSVMYAGKTFQECFDYLTCLLVP